jgi:hypothetical protein
MTALGAAFDSACKELHDKGQPTIDYEVIPPTGKLAPVPVHMLRLFERLDEVDFSHNRKLRR